MYKILFIEESEYISTGYHKCITKQDAEEYFFESHHNWVWYTHERKAIVLKENRMRFEIVEVPDV